MGARRRGAQNFALFFPSPGPTFAPFSLSLGVFSWKFGGVFEAPGPLNVHVWRAQGPAEGGPAEGGPGRKSLTGGPAQGVSGGGNEQKSKNLSIRKITQQCAKKRKISKKHTIKKKQTKK